MIQAHKGEIARREVRPILIEMSDLALLFGQVAEEMEAQSAPSSTFDENIRFDLRGNRFPALRLHRATLPYGRAQERNASLKSPACGWRCATCRAAAYRKSAWS